VCIDSLLENILAQFQYKLEGNDQLTLILEGAPENKNLVVSTDRTKLGQVVTNLVGNAVKFTSEGHIKVQWKYVNGELFIQISDTGIGIRQDEQALVFERFRQAENARESGKGGSGLGLSISQAYASLLDGCLELASEYGKGSCFTLRIPARQVNSNPELDDDSKDAEGRESVSASDRVVLVAEDDPVNFEFISALFKMEKVPFVHAWNGLEVLEKLAERDDICVVLMDIKMPRMDGYQALDELRKQGYTLPVVAQTAYALPEDRKRIEKAGFDGYITKPINRANLLQSVRAYLETT